MRAVVYHAPKCITVDTVKDLVIQHERDAIQRVTLTAICGSDLHMYNGTFPQPKPLILGHEFMGIVEDVGPAVRNLAVGDRVVVPFPISCGDCWFCARGMPVHCERSNPKHYGPEGALLDQKGGASTDIPISTVATPVARRNWCACLLPMSARARCHRS